MIGGDGRRKRAFAAGLAFVILLTGCGEPGSDSRARSEDAGTADETPDIDEEEVAAFDEAPLFAPTNLPPGYKLLSVSVLDVVESENVCSEVKLSYFDPAAYKARYVDRDEEVLAPRFALTLSAKNCPFQDELAPGGEPYSAGSYSGTIYRPPGSALRPGEYPFVFVYLDIAETRIEVESNLPDEQINAAIGSLAPLDLMTQPVYRGPSLIGAAAV